MTLRFGQARGLRRQAWLLAVELFCFGRHLWGVVRAQTVALDQPLRLNLGSFTDVREGWVNIDPFVLWGGTLPLDVREPLPFPDASCELVHAEHFLEHVVPSDALRLLRECRRVLQPEGVLSIAVPDLAPLLTAYPEALPDEQPLPRGELPTALGRINWLMRGDSLHPTHLYAYDEPTLRLLLESAGFVACARRAFDPTLDLEMRREGTLRMGARR